MTAMHAPELLTQLAAGNPAEQLVEELIRLRQKGLAFELAWNRSLRVLRWPKTKETRRQWKAVIEDGKAYYRSCYSHPGVRLTIGEIVQAMSLGADLHEESESVGA